MHGLLRNRRYYEFLVNLRIHEVRNLLALRGNCADFYPRLVGGLLWRHHVEMRRFWLGLGRQLDLFQLILLFAKGGRVLVSLSLGLLARLE